MSNIFFMVSINRDLDPVDDLSFIRMRSMKNEILLAPGKAVTESLQASPLQGFPVIVTLLGQAKVSQ